MRILVVGGTRFIGAAAVRRLRARGHEVAVLNRRKSPHVLPHDVVRIRGDRDRLHESRGAIDRFAPDVVVHDVVHTKAHAEHAVSFFRGMVERFVMLSSMDVYRAYGRLLGTEPGPLEPMPQDEEGPLRDRLYPLRPEATDASDVRWGYDKIPAEHVVLGDEDLPGTVLRLPMVLGHGDYQHRLFPFVRPMVDGRETIVMQEDRAHWLSTYAYVENVGEAIAAACTNPHAANRVYNVADGALSWLELGALAAREFSWDGAFVLYPPEELPESLVVPLRWEQSIIGTADRIGEELDYRPLVELEDGVLRAAAWERDHPPDPAPVESLGYDAQDQVLAQG